MFKLYVIIVSLAFLASQTHSFSPLLDIDLKFESSDELVVNFKNPELIRRSIHTQELIVKPETCSIRVDFNRFTFRPPVQLTSTTAFVCPLNHDSFKFISHGLPEINIPTLCGELSEQHIYLQTKDYDQLNSTVTGTLNLKANYLDGILSEAPIWDITLTQIPCQLDDVNSEPGQLSLPPVGCLQYYTEPSGTIKSFNLFYGSYFGHFNYTICFEQSPDTCGIKLTGIEFGLSTNGDSSTGRNCDTADELNAVVSKDYLLIPDGQIKSVDDDVVVSESKFCGNSLLEREVIVERQGVISITFVADNAVIPSIPEIGFQIDYEPLTEC